MQKLPYSDLVLAMGISSLVGTLFCCGPFGIIFSIIGLIYAQKANTIYKDNPSKYIGYNNVSVGKVMSWIGLVLGLLMLVFFIIYFGVIMAFFIGENYSY